jgi:glycosyltransferase involved in cell wall biosynthesis
MSAEPRPTVSIIMAAYNRSNVLRIAVETVRWQTFTDWELLVVGDACTDDTADVVASFQDSRIKFTNLERNTGDQSGPNNHGMKQARGRYLAFLNQDDLWMPDHLQTLLQAIEATSADLVFTPSCRLGPGEQAALRPLPASLTYSPRMFVPASNWLLRRELAEVIGPWRRACELYYEPSQEWLFRAWKQRKRMVLVPHFTVLMISSVNQPGAYRNRTDSEQRNCLERIRSEPDFRAQMAVLMAATANDSELVSGLREQPGSKHSLRGLLGSARWRLTDALVWLGRRLALPLGLHPHAVEYFIRYRGRGGFVNWLRNRRGLDPLPSADSKSAPCAQKEQGCPGGRPREVAE